MHFQTARIGRFEFFYISFTSFSQIQNQYTFGGTQDDRAYDIIQTTDGGYAIAGGAEVAGSTATILIKLGPDGKLY